MSRCIIVGGLPLLHRSVRSELLKQIHSIVHRTLINLSQIELPGKPFRVDVSVNQHHRIEETVRIICSDQVDVELVKNLCGTLQGSALENRIELRRQGHHEILDNEKTSTTVMSTRLTVVLNFSLGAGAVRDHGFPSMPWHLRRQIRCDGVGIQSLTPERAANRMAKLLRCFFEAVDPCKQSETKTEENDELVVDGMAGIGGNTMGFLKYWKNVLALELDPVRANMLRFNTELWETWQNYRENSESQKPTIRMMNTCFIDFLSSFLISTGDPNNLTKSSVLFLDPPWVGGHQPQYKEKIAEQDGDIIIQKVADESNNEHHKHLASHLVDCRTNWSFSKALCQIVQLGVFQVVAVKVPTVYDEDALLVTPLVHDETLSGTMERTHPFRFSFGSSTKLIVLVRNQHGHDPLFANGPNGLDRMIHNIMNWHNATDLQSDDGCREHRPEFYDWEKRRWIMLKKWKGSTATTNTKQDADLLQTTR